MDVKTKIAYGTERYRDYRRECYNDRKLLLTEIPVSVLYDVESKEEDLVSMDFELVEHASHGVFKLWIWLPLTELEKVKRKNRPIWQEVGSEHIITKDCLPHQTLE